MYIGTVLLIQSLASLSALSGDWKARAGCAVRAVSIGMAAWGLWLFIRFLRTEHGGDGPLSAAVLLWIASIALYQMFGTGGEKTQNAGEGIRKKYPKNKDGA